MQQHIIELFNSWISVSSSEIIMIFLSCLVIYLTILILTRIVGLRSFSKMSASDFAMTVAVGSLFASSISSPSPTLGVSMAALIALFGGQWVFAWMRTKGYIPTSDLENEPLLLMKDGSFFEKNLRRANITKSDIYAKLREANALKLEHVRAVVFETTGDISVLHAADSKLTIDPVLLEDVCQ